MEKEILNVKKKFLEHEKNTPNTNISVFGVPCIHSIWHSTSFPHPGRRGFNK